jgi:hypothetical protein
MKNGKPVIYRDALDSMEMLFGRRLNEAKAD